MLNVELLFRGTPAVEENVFANPVADELDSGWGGGRHEDISLSRVNWGVGECAPGCEEQPPTESGGRCVIAVDGKTPGPPESR